MNFKRCFLFNLLLVFFVAPVYASDSVNVGVYQNSPKVFINSEGKPAGFFVDLINTIALREKWKLKYVPCVWEQCLSKLAEGQLDIMVDVAYSKSRDQSFDFNKQAVISSWSVIYQRKGQNIESIIDLDEKNIAVLKGSIQYKALKMRSIDFGISPIYHEVNAFEEALTLIAQNKTDFALFNRFYGDRHLLEHNLETSHVLVRPAVLKFAVPQNKNQHLILAIDKHLKILKQQKQSIYYRSMQKWLTTKPLDSIAPWVKWLLRTLSMLLFALIVVVFVSRTILHRKTAELSKVESLLKSAINSTPDLIFFKDIKSVYLGCNSAFEIFTGKKPSEIVGQTDMDLFDKEDAEFFREKDRKMLESGTTRQNEEWVVYPDGKRVLLETLKTPFFDAEKKIIGLLGVSRDITEHRRMGRELQKSERNFRTLYDQAPLPYQSLDAEGNILSVNQAWLAMLQYNNAEGIIGHNITEFLTRDSAALLPDRLSNFIQSGEICGKEFDILTKLGNKVTVTIDGKIRLDENGDFVQTHCILTDITARRVADARLRQSAAVFENTIQGVIITDPDACIVDVNKAFVDITGYSREEVLGKNTRLLQSGRQDKEFYQAMWRSLTEEGKWQGEIWNRRKDGSVYPEWLNISCVYDEENNLSNYVSVFTDISSIKQSQEKLNFLAHHDILTGLPNRLLLNDRLEQAVKHAKRNTLKLAVIFIDLDRFKNINDSMGHATGDDLLIQVALRLKNVVRDEDTVARYSGDEFIVLLEDIESYTNTVVAVEKLVHVFRQAFLLNEQEIRITGSLGISLYPDDGENCTDLLLNADAAMYRAKDDGRNSYLFYSSEFTRDNYEHVLLENALRGALDRNELFLVYQPQFALNDERMIGIETLLRWNNPGMGNVSPSVFIPIAEASGLIHDIGAWVLKMACVQGKNWLDKGIAFRRVSVNVSVSQLQSRNFVEVVKNALSFSGLAAENLELEVTEGFILQNVEQGIKQLSTLRSLGISLAIDDFGTGYSSLSYLKRLPIQKLKIDQSFVRDIPDDTDDMAIAEAIIALGKALDLTVIAEGVETTQQAVFLQERGCHEVQGYLFSKPISAAVLESLYTTGSAGVRQN